MKWIFLTIAIAGYIFNIKDKKLISYVLWLVSNTGWGIYNLVQHEYELFIMFMVYNVFSIYGILNCRPWRKLSGRSKEQ